MPVAAVRQVTFEDVAVLKHALDTELKILSDKSDVEVSILVALNGQVLASCVPYDLDSGLFRLLSLVRANIPFLRREITLGGIQQSITRYEAGNVVVTRVGKGELLISLLEKHLSVTKNLPQIYTTVQILSHVSSQKPIGERELSEYGEEVADELAELTQRLYAELESEGVVGERKKNEETLASFRAALERVVGKAESEMIMVIYVNQLGIRTKQVSPAQWRELVAAIRGAVETKAGRYYAEMIERQLMEIVVRAEELF